MKRKAIRRPGRPSKRKAIVIKEVVEFMGKKFVIDHSEKARLRAYKAIARRMFVCFGRASEELVSKKVRKRLMKERLAYLTKFKKSLNVKTQTLSTQEERDALLSNTTV